ncbi:MAG: glutamate synthase subunit alpha, partial [Alphaproteobacteria bacterium]|nr:glutamate synthase subunit alpha [Alphaproteobacteria bacterium]
MHGSDHKQPAGLYDPDHEHDNCGVGFIANIKGRKSHEIVRQGLQILVNLDHRGAVGADPLAGDGAGILIQVPDRLLREEMASQGVTLPAAGGYGVGMVFLPRVEKTRDRCVASIERAVTTEGATILGWRDVPTDNSCLGESVAGEEPLIRQILVAPPASMTDQDTFERKLFVIRKQSHGKIWYPGDDGEGDETGVFYITSMSSRTIVYKGMVLSGNLPVYYPDLRDERAESALALV